MLYRFQPSDGGYGWTSSRYGLACDNLLSAEVVLADAKLNFTPEADRVRDAYTDSTYSRLVALKDKYDPYSLFQLNQNIAPTNHSRTRCKHVDSRCRGPSPNDRHVGAECDPAGS